MKRSLLFFIIVLLIALASTLAYGSEIFPLSNVKTGLKGYGLTSVSGDKVGRFNFEVLGVMKNTTPGTSIVIIRIQGLGLEKTGVFSGMSGSPVYIDGKLLGAVAYSFPYSTAPIAGVTPFEEMKKALSPKSPKVPPVKGIEIIPKLDASKILERNLNFLKKYLYDNLSVMAASGQAMYPIATPIMVGGANPEAISNFQPLMRSMGWVMMAGGNSGASEKLKALKAKSPSLKPGSGLVVSLVQGDFNVGAGGTVTDVEGETVYAFGHPFLGAGKISMPLHASKVITLVPNLNNSFKLFTTGELVGSIIEDRVTGILGKIGAKPNLLPVKVQILNSQNQENVYHFQVIKDNYLSPVLVNFAVYNFITSAERSVGYLTVVISAKIFLENGDEIPLRNIFSNPVNAPLQSSQFVSIPLQYLFLSGFKDCDVKRLEINLKTEEKESTARIEDVMVEKQNVYPGDRPRCTVHLQGEDGTIFTESFTIPIPESIPPGPIKVYVGDGTNLDRLDQKLEPGRFKIYTANQLVRALKDLRQNGTIYVKLYRKGGGYYARGKAFLSLPPSFETLFTRNRAHDSGVPIRYVHYYEDSLGNKDYVVSGFRSFELNIKSR